MAEDEACPWVAAELKELEVESKTVTLACGNRGAASDSLIQGMAILFSFHYFHSMDSIYHCLVEVVIGTQTIPSSRIYIYSDSYEVRGMI